MRKIDTIYRIPQINFYLQGNILIVELTLKSKSAEIQKPNFAYKVLGMRNFQGAGKPEQA